MRTSLLALFLVSAAHPAFACCQISDGDEKWLMAQQRPQQFLQGPIAQTPEEEPPLPSVESDAVFVANFGNSIARLQYWNPADSKWVTVEIPTGGSITIRCQKCDKKIKISWHDGSNENAMDLSLGEPYAWWWAGFRWDIGSYGWVRRQLHQYWKG